MWMRVIVVVLLALILTTPQEVWAQQVIWPSELRQAIVEHSTEKKEQLRRIREFFRTEEARAALSTASFDALELDRALATLRPEQLAALAARTERIQADFAAGALTNQQLTYVVIALATAVIILVIVAA